MIRPLRSRTKSSRRSQTSSETTLKGSITSWRSQPLSWAPPTISWRLRNTGTQRGGLRSLLVQSPSLGVEDGRSRRQLVCLVIICDQAFDMRQFLVEVFAPLLLVPIPRKLLEGNKGGPWLKFCEAKNAFSHHRLHKP